MGKTNWGRVIVGGLLAGLVLNIGEYLLNELVLGDDWEAVMETYGLGAYTGSDIAMMVAWTFLLGIVLVWLYAAIRPRYGPGPATAVRAGLTGWLLLYGFWYLYNLASGMFPRDIVTISLIWGLFELPIATLVGAWMYREGEAAEPPAI